MKSPIQRQLEIFSAALERPAGRERDAFLAQACAGDDALRQCVDALLAGHAQAGTFLASAAGPLGPTGTAIVPVTEKPGDKIGRYKLREKIGEGGCGVVYVAEQEEPVRRRVALKVIKLGMDTKSVVARFEAERQALAMMDHPNIAKVLDAGATDTGRPYFVMELVRGIKITDYCDQNNLSTRERLDLFIKVCQAVQHAHQKGIIHRDLKPSNILVTLHDGVPVPKVIDFGIAKATEGRLTDATVYTELHQFIGTPAYMSPEQAEMSGLDIDTRSDIYSLGVLLYELLTGKTPFDARELWEAGLDAMRRTIREREPMRPSTRLETMVAGELTTTAKHRQSEPPKLINLLRGDLDWIVMKCLEKDRTRRYETAASFAHDIQRHLSNEPVVARPPSVLYKLQKAVRRNKPAFAAAAAVLLTLLAGLGLTAWQAVRASRAEHLARVSAEKARGDRDRAVVAESNATQHAAAATNALQTAQERMVKLHTAEGWRRVEEGDYFGALLPFAEAFALDGSNPDRVKLHQMRLGGVLQEAPKLVNVWRTGAEILHAEFNRDGSKLLTASRISSNQVIARVWDSATGRPLTDPLEHINTINSLEWSRDESRIVTASIDGIARVWDAATGRPLSEPLRHRGPVVRARFSPDGGRIATLSLARFRDPENGPMLSFKRLSIWNVATSRLLGTNMLKRGAYNHPVLFTPDARSVLSFHGLHDGTNAALRTPLGAFSFSESMWMNWTDRKEDPPFQNGVSDEEIDALHANSEFSPDGSRLFVCSSPRNAASLQDGSEPSRIILRWGRQDKHLPVLGRFSPDGSLLATANNNWTLTTWDSVDGDFLVLPMKHQSPILDLRFSPDGRQLASGTKSGDARVWDALSGEPISAPLPHSSAVLRVAFSQDGTRLRAACADGHVAEWDLRTIRRARFTWTGMSKHAPSFSRDELMLASAKSGHERVIDLAGGQLRLPPLWTGMNRLSIHGQPDLRLEIVGSSIVGVDWNKWSVWNLDTGRRVDLAAQHPASFTEGSRGRLSRNGRWVASYHYGSGSNVTLFNAVTGELVANSKAPKKVFDVTIRADGRQMFATLFADDGAVVWDLPGETPAFRIESSPTYSISGKYLSSQVRGEEPEQPWAVVWDSSTGNEVFRAALQSHYHSSTITSDDRWWIIRDESGYRILDLSAGARELRRLSCPKSDDEEIGWHNTALAEDGTLLVSIGVDSVMRFWHPPSGERILPDRTAESFPSRVWMNPLGTGFASWHEDKTLRYWVLPQGERPVFDWLALARFFAKGRGEPQEMGSAAAPAARVGALADPPGASPTPNASESAARSGVSGEGAGHGTRGRVRSPFHDEWLALRAKHPEVFTVSADEIDAWHRHEAWRCESRKDWSNAVHHLSELLKTHPDSGDFLPRRAAACVAWADNLTAPAANAVTPRPVVVSTPQAKAILYPHEERRPNVDEEMRRKATATNLLERALDDYNRTLAWVERFPAIAKESRKPFVEQRREVYLKLGCKTEAEADEQELKGRN